MYKIKFDEKYKSKLFPKDQAFGIEYVHLALLEILYTFKPPLFNEFLRTLSRAVS